ncbi:MAG: hypothetical protein PHE79_06775 [Eubacteriales bacterium]|nr:hypothetical protein [Eubacteriales bacterium]
MKIMIGSISIRHGGFFRSSVGLDDSEDIFADLDQAFRADK